MMNRRQAFGAALAAGLAVAAPAAASVPAPAPQLLRVHKWTGSGFLPCRMYHLKRGDVFTLEGVGTFRAHTDPAEDADGVWGIGADSELDPAAEKWAPATSAA